MEDKNYLIIILLLALGLRAYNMRHPYFIGNDAYQHYSVIRQAMNGEGMNNYSLSIGSPEILEPKGFYYITLIPAYLIGLDNAFLVMPLISGLICIFLSYLLMKDLFNERVGLITALILALSIAHAYRTSPNTYRGDGFYLTIFLGILYSFNKSLKSQKHSILTGTLLGLSASIWNGYPIGVLVILSGLIINLTLQYWKGKLRVSDLKNTLYLLVSYYLVERLLMLTGVTGLLFFTQNTGFHALITFSPILLGVTYYLFKSKNKKKTLGLILIAGVTLVLLDWSTIKSIIDQGLLGNSLFFEIGVSELLPPTYELLNTMLSWTLYLLWPGLILLIFLLLKKPQTNRLTYLVWCGVSIYLMLAYSRYNFIGSFTTASLSALFISYLWKNQKVGMVALAVFLAFYGYDTFNNVNRIGPRMNAYWADALEWMDANVEPGMTLSWWDHGSWIQYYTESPTIVDSVAGQSQTRIKRIAEFLMTDKTEDFSDWGAEYLVLGGDVILYSGAVLGIAGVSDFDLAIIQEKGISSLNGQEITIFPMGSGRFEVYSDGAIYRDNNGMLVLNKTYYANKTGTTILSPEYEDKKGCLVINPVTTLYFNDQACNSNYVQLMYGNGLPNYKELYRNDFVVIYKIIS